MTAWHKKAFYFIVKNLPTPIRHSVYRSLYAEIPTTMPDGLTFELARTRDDIEAAFKLLHDAYVEQGFIDPQPSGMRLIVQHALPTTSILVAKLNDKVIGTISVMRDTPLGLPMEKVFDISNLKLQGKRVAELSCLAIHPDFRRKMGGNIFFPLTLFAATYSMNSFGTDYLVWNLYPHHADFYNAIFGSTHLNGDKKICKDYLGAPAAGIQVDLSNVEIFAKKKYAHKDVKRNLHAYTFITKHPFFKYPPKEVGVINYPVMTPEFFQYFFAQRTKILQNMTELEEQVIARYYPLESYAKVIPISRYKVENKRSHERWDIRITGACLTPEGSKIKMILLDVSLHGFKVHLSEEVKLNQRYFFEVALPTGEKAVMVASATWKSDDNVYGFKIANANKKWNELIDMQADALKKIAA